MYGRMVFVMNQVKKPLKLCKMHGVEIASLLWLAEKVLGVMRLIIDWMRTNDHSGSYPPFTGRCVLG